VVVDPSFGGNNPSFGGNKEEKNGY